MVLLLDTHAVLWFVGGNTRLPRKALGLIEDPSNRIIISAASLFEISIKLKVDTLVLDQTLDETFKLIAKSFIELIPITPPHLLAYQIFLSMPIIVIHSTV